MFLPTQRHELPDHFLAFANPTRLRILQRLGEVGEENVNDLAVHLRYPTGRETSAALLRVLAQGRPTVVSDLEHLADIPDAGVVRVDPTDEEGALTRAILRLHDKPEARARLGQAAREFVRREHSPARCLDGYEAAMARAAALPDPPPRPWPAHWPRPASPPRP
jgi:DNA-binding transcriptional ArsR family regulator